VLLEVANGIITVKEKWSTYTGVFDVTTVEDGQVQVDRSSDHKDQKQHFVSSYQ
jgi:large subunit ribosomal protein L6